MIEEERIKRSFADQVRTQQAEIGRLQQVLNQRSLNVVVEFTEGLGVLLTLAAAGDPGARQVLGQLKDRLKQLEAVMAGLVVVKS